jgi:hypothetical protein
MLLKTIKVFSMILVLTVLMTGCIASQQNQVSPTSVSSTPQNTPTETWIPGSPSNSSIPSTYSVTNTPKPTSLNGIDYEYSNIARYGDTGYPGKNPQMWIVTSNQTLPTEIVPYIMNRDVATIKSLDYSQFLVIIVSNGLVSGGSSNSFGIKKVIQNGDSISVIAQFSLPINKIPTNMTSGQVIYISKNNLPSIRPITFKLLDESGQEKTNQITVQSLFPTPASSPVSGNNTPPTDVFGFRRFIWDRTGTFLLGYANVPDGTRLSLNVQSVSRSFISTPGKAWYINLDNTGLVRGPGYSFKIWETAHPDISATFTLPYPLPVVTQNPELSGTSWKLIFMKGTDFSGPSGIDATFGLSLDKGGIGGNTKNVGYGCNYETDSPDKIFIYRIVEGGAGSSNYIENQSDTYFDFLRSAATFKIVENRLEIYDIFGLKTLVFERI